MRHPEARAKWAGRSLVVSVVALVAAVGWGVYQNVEQDRKLEGVDRVSPCRVLGIAAPECKREARLTVKSCLTHKPCRKLVVRLTSGPNTLPDSDKPVSSSATRNTGGDAQQPPSQAPQQPGPPSGGPPGGNGNPPGNPPNPPRPPEPPEQPGLLDPVLDPACDVTKPLNLCR